MLQTSLLLLILTVQDLSSRALPDHQSFMAEARKRMRTDTQLLGQYTYTLKRTSMIFRRAEGKRRTARASRR